MPDDIKAVAPAVLRHRIVLSADAQLDGRRIDDQVRDILAATAAPRA
jgi:MoxR-like ATPase